MRYSCLEYITFLDLVDQISRFVKVFSNNRNLVQYYKLCNIYTEQFKVHGNESVKRTFEMFASENNYLFNL